MSRRLRHTAGRFILGGEFSAGQYAQNVGLTRRQVPRAATWTAVTPHARRSSNAVATSTALYAGGDFSTIGHYLLRAIRTSLCRAWVRAALYIDGDNFAMERATQ